MPAERDILRVRGISVDDERGTERVYIGAPAVNPISFGKRFRRDAAFSGILLFDREGNQRSGTSPATPAGPTSSSPWTASETLNPRSAKGARPFSKPSHPRWRLI
jgi:hypothetical protein